MREGVACEYVCPSSRNLDQMLDCVACEFVCA